MDPEMQKLIRYLQDQKCPPAVLDRVAERIPRQATPRPPLRSLLAAAILVTCVLVALVAWQWNVRREARLLAAEQAVIHAQTERALVVQQTQQAFAYIGGAFIRAASHTQNALLKEAVPPLRNSLETVKNKVPNAI